MTERVPGRHVQVEGFAAAGPAGRDQALLRLAKQVVAQRGREFLLEGEQGIDVAGLTARGYVHAVTAPGDMVIDLDHVVVALHGTEKHALDVEFRGDLLDLQVRVADAAVLDREIRDVVQGLYEFVLDAVDDVLLIRVAAQVFAGQDRNRAHRRGRMRKQAEQHHGRYGRCCYRPAQPTTPCRDRRWRRGGRRLRHSWLSGLQQHHRLLEPVATPDQRLYILVRPLAIAQGPAQLRDALVDGVVGNRTAIPDFIDEIVLRQDLAVPHGQSDQRLHHLGLGPLDVVAAAQFGPRWQDLPVPDPEALFEFFSSRHVLCSSPPRSCGYSTRIDDLLVILVTW